MFVQVRLVLERDARIVMVPKTALSSVAGLTKLFVLANGRVSEKRIPPGQEFDGWIEVPSDMVHPGDRVAISGLAALVEGVPVKAIPAKGAKG
jgi:multidrug efflux pump subunit AcrA (membrane-fusion protein)